MKLILTFIISISSFLAISAEPLSISCSNIQGNSLDSSGGKAATSKDGYSGTKIKLTVTDSSAKVTYTGRVNRTDELKLVTGSKDGWLIFSAGFSDVYKLYTIYPKKMILSLVEVQTELYSGNPQVRSFMATCK